MASDPGRDDFIIAIPSAYFKSGPVEKFRAITKDVIFKGSFFVSVPFVYIKDNYYTFHDHLRKFKQSNRIL